MDKKEAIEKLEAMLNRYDAYHPNNNEFTEYDCEDIRAVIEWVNSIEERPTGEWILDKEHSITMDFYKCTNCNYVCGTNQHRYCPRCGAKMEAENEDSN